MNPVSWTKQKRGFYMSKLTYEDKLNIYKERKNGETINFLTKKYKVRKEVINYLTRLIDKHGYDILRTNQNRKFTSCEKEIIINRVLINNESANSVAIDEGLLSQGMLQNWIKEYKENCYNIVERKRGRSPTMKKAKQINKKVNETDKEKIKRLEEENLYLKAELEYSKKLRAVVQARKNQQQKKK